MANPDSNIDLSLAVLDVVRPRGTPLTCAVIAEVCGCARQLIYQTESRGLRKIKNNLTQLHGAIDEELIERHSKIIFNRLLGAM